MKVHVYKIQYIKCMISKSFKPLVQYILAALLQPFKEKR